MDEKGVTDSIATWLMETVGLTCWSLGTEVCDVLDTD